MSTGPLDGIRVIDLTRARSGPTAVRQLAEMGADVLKVEAREDPDVELGRHGFDFQNLHRNKRSMTLNLKAPAGVEILKKLAARADVLVENFRPDVTHRLGIDYERLSTVNPRLIYASISGFGQSGPYRDRPGYDQIVQGMSGLMWLTGTDEVAPLRVGIPVGDLLAGYFCALGILAALIERAQSGKGQWVSTSLLEALAGSLSFQAVKYLNTGEVPPPVGNHHPLTAPMGVYRTGDGYMNLAVGNDDMFARLGGVLGQPGLARDERFARSGARVKNRGALDEILLAALATRPTAAWIETLNAAGVACGPIFRLDEVFADPQVGTFGLVHEQEHPAFGLVKVLGLPVQLSRTPPTVRSPAPAPGAHTREVLTALGYDTAAIDRLAAEGVIEVLK